MQVAGNENIKLFLFHIYPNQMMVADSSFPTGIDSDTFINAEFITELRNQAEESMLALVDELKTLQTNQNKTNINIDHMTAGGEPEYEIKQLCDGLNPDLIIMGTRGGGKKGFLEGSMAEKLMNATSIPLIAVPESFKEVRIKNIMYALNFSDFDYQNIKMIMDLFKHLEKEIFIIHIELKDSDELESKMMQALEEQLKSSFPDEKFNFHILNGADKTIALKDVIEVFSIDLIAFIAHKTSFFKNLFSSQIHKKDFFKLELPMLALNEKI
jgi:nucleotide-binding universal stress UspA family protein